MKNRTIVGKVVTSLEFSWNARSNQSHVGSLAVSRTIAPRLLISSPP